MEMTTHIATRIPRQGGSTEPIRMPRTIWRIVGLRGQWLGRAWPCYGHLANSCMCTRQNVRFLSSKPVVNEYVL